MKFNYPILLDGGLSNELERQGHDLNHPLWSARLLQEEPEAIIQAHLAYLEVGAQCILTASYQASIPGFLALGYSRETAEGLILKSVELAEEAVKKYQNVNRNTQKPLIAGSIGPYGAFLADGSEYSGDYGVSDKIMQNFHQRRIELLNTSHADILACETIPSFQEIRILAKNLLKVDKPAWVSFSCKDGNHINDGTPIAECVKLLSKHPKVFAIGVNCTAPVYISSLIKIIKKVAPSKKIIVYPNSGETYDAETKSWSGISSPESCRHLTKEWLALGANIIGGCCRMGPSHIQVMGEVIGG